MSLFLGRKIGCRCTGAGSHLAAGSFEPHRLVTKEGAQALPVPPGEWCLVPHGADPAGTAGTGAGSAHNSVRATPAAH